MADHAPVVAIVLAVGGAAVGGPEALRLLLALEGPTAAADMTICVLLFCAFTALLLGTLLLARFLRDADAHPGAPAQGTERFARVTLTVALTVLCLVTTCLLVVPTSLGGPGVGGVRRMPDAAGAAAPTAPASSSTWSNVHEITNACNYNSIY